MGDLVNIVKPDGTVVTVDREVAEALTGQKFAPHMETPEERADRARTEYNRENTSPVVAGVASGVNTAFFGAPGMFYDESTREAIRTHPGAAKIGSLAAVLAPTGLLGSGAKAVSEATFLGQAAKLGAGGSVAGRAMEGGIIGGGIHMADASLSDDPLSGEALAESIGMGSLLSVGLGAVTDKALRMLTPKAGKFASGIDDLLPEAQAVTKRGPAPLAAAARAQAALDEAQAVAAGASESAAVDAVVRQAKADVQAARQALDEAPEYAAFRDSYDAGQKALREANKVAQTTADNFKEWAGSGMRSTLNEFEGAQNSIRTKLAKLRAKDPTGMRGAAARDAARAAGEEVPLDETSSLVGMSNDIDELKRFSKNLLDSPDPRAANAVYSKMAGVNDKLTQLGLKAPKLPELPTGEVQELGAALPEKLSDIGKLREESVARIANALDANGQIEAVNLARKLGLDAESAGDALVGIRNQMRDMYHLPDLSKEAAREAEAVAKAGKAAEKANTARKFEEASQEVDRARSVTGGRIEWSFKDGELVAGTGGDKGPIPGVRRWVKAGLQSATARAAYSPGWKGALVSRLAYGAAGYAVGGMDGALFGASVGSARSETLGRIRSVVSAAAQRGVTGLGAMRPLASYLGARGAESSRDLYDGKAAVALMNEVHAQALTAPDAMYSLSKGIMGQPGDLAYKLYAKTTSAVQYLSQMAPKDPGIDIEPGKSNWEPNADEINTWLHRYEAVMHPVEYTARVLAGEGDMAGVEALAVNWPYVHQMVQAEAAAQRWDGLSNDQAAGLSMLFGKPVNGASDPDLQMMIQAQYVAAASARKRAQGTKPSRGTGKPTGRPPAVQSPTLGSNVSGHTKGY